MSINRDAKPQIVVIGAAILDVLARPASSAVFETGSLPMDSIRLSTGGDAANEAVVLSYLGKRVQLETVIGTDKGGDFLKSFFADRQVFLPDYVFREEIPTGVNIVLVDEQGERHFLTDPGGSLRALEEKHIHLPFPESAEIVCFASIFVFPKIKKQELEAVFRAAKSQGKIVCADLTRRKNQETLEEMKEVFALVDYLFPNEKEAMLLSGTETTEEAAEAFFRAGTSCVILKCGRRGCYIRSEEFTGMVQPERVLEPVDTTGAGDSFAAGFLAGLLDGCSVEECARLGNRCGGRAVLSVGAVEWTERSDESV